MKGEGKNTAEILEDEKSGKKYFILDFKLRPDGTLTWKHDGFASVELRRISGNRFKLTLGNPKAAGEPTIVVPGQFDISSGGIIMAKEGSIPV